MLVTIGMICAAGLVGAVAGASVSRHLSQGTIDDLEVKLKRYDEVAQQLHEALLKEREERKKEQTRRVLATIQAIQEFLRRIVETRQVVDLHRLMIFEFCRSEVVEIAARIRDATVNEEQKRFLRVLDAMVQENSPMDQSDMLWVSEYIGQRHGNDMVKWLSQQLEDKYLATRRNLEKNEEALRELSLEFEELNETSEIRDLTQEEERRKQELSKEIRYLEVDVEKAKDTLPSQQHTLGIVTRLGEVARGKVQPGPEDKKAQEILMQFLESGEIDRDVDNQFLSDYGRANYWAVDSALEQKRQQMSQSYDG